MTSRQEYLSLGSGKRHLITLILAVSSLCLLAGVHSTWAEGPGNSECVGCHTDAAKLKALTPPDPPSSEEGEG